jgi:phage gp29-like protein
MKFKIPAVSDLFNKSFGGGKNDEHERAVSQMVNAIKRQHTLYNKEIRDWKVARAAALDPIMPRRKPLIDIMEEVLDDPFIFGRSDTRKLRVSNKAVAVQEKSGEINEEKTKLLEKMWFKNCIKYALDSIYFSYTLMYPKELDENGFIKTLSYVYRDHIIPETTEILINPYDQSGQNFREGELRRWTLWINHEHSIGLLNKAIPLWIFKKHSWQNWDEFEEMFGIPMRTAKVASTDPRVKREVDKWLKDLGSAGWARFPEGVEIDIKESNSRDSFNVFNEKRKACNEELANLFDGNSESANDKGSRAKTGEIINNTQKLITMDDETFVLFFINDELLPWLRELGYPFDENDRCIWNDNEKLSPKERLDIFKGVKDLGYKVKKEQIETELDVEIVGEVENKIIASNPQNRRVNFNTPHNHHLGCGAMVLETPVNTRDLNPDEESFLRQLYENPDSINWNYKEFKASHTPLLDSLKRGFGSMDYDFDSTDHRRMAAWMNNIHRFGVDKTQAEVYELNQMLKSPDVKSFNDFRNKVKPIFPKYKDFFLQTEWDHANATSNMAARYLEMMDDIDIAPFWKFDAILDERTTVVCNSLEGKVFDKRDKNSWKFLPPLHWKCRSDAQDVFDYEGEVTSFDDAIKADPDGWERMQKQGFDVNWGDSDEIFTQTQSYLRKLPAGTEPIKVEDLGITDYGLPEWAKVKKHAYPEKAVTIRSHIDKTGMARIITAQDLPVWVDVAENLDNDTFTRIKETLSIPDEIYWNDSGDIPYTVFLRFFEDGAFKVTTQSVKVTGFEMVQNADTVRKGLLVYTPSEYVSYSRQLYKGYPKEWQKEFFNDQNGGFVVTNKNRISKAKVNKQETSKYKKEFSMAKVFAGSGFRMELLDEIAGISSPDALFNGLKADLKSISSHNNIIRDAKKAIYKQGADVVLFEFTNDTPKIHLEILKLRKMNIKAYYYFTGKENMIFNTL